MIIDLSQQSASQNYFTMTQAVLPRPIAWVLSKNEGGNYNLAPFSYFNAVCSDPPLLAISIGRQPDGREKDTLVNITARREFVIHIASCNQYQELNQTAAMLPPGESEVSASNIELSQVEGFSMPRITNCKLAFMCRTHQIQEIVNKNQALVLAEIDAIYVEDECTQINEKGRFQIDAKKIEPLARLGASQYAFFGEIMSLKRP